MSSKKCIKCELVKDIQSFRKNKSLELNHYSNLQPLEASENIKKSNKMPWDL